MTVALGVIFILSNLFLLDRRNGKYVVLKIESEFLNTQKKFITADAKLEQFSNISNSKQLFDNEKWNEFCSDLDFTVLVKKSDSLIYWNTNRVTLPELDIQKDTPLDTVLLLNNGYYQIHASIKGVVSVYFLKHIYSVFAFENNFLANTFDESFGPEAFRYKYIPLLNGEFVVHNERGNPVFSIILNTDKSGSIVSFLFILFVLVFWITCLNILLLNVLRTYFSNRENSIKLIFVYIFGLLLIRLSIEGMEKLFGFDALSDIEAGFFSFGFLFPGLNDLVLFVQSLFFVSLIVFKHGCLDFDKKLSIIFLKRTSLIFGIIISFYLYIFFVEQILFNSTIPLSFNALYGFNSLSYLLLLVLVFLSFSFILIIYRLISIIFVNNLKIKQICFVLFTGLIFIHFISQIFYDYSFLPPVLILGYFILAYFYLPMQLQAKKIIFFAFTIILFSSLLTLIFYKINTKKIESEQVLVAYKLGLETDPMFEFLYSNVEELIKSDTTLRKMLDRNDSGAQEEEVSKYLNNNYFNGYINRFSIEISLCDQFKKLNIQPENYLVNCKDYFNDLIKTSGKPTENPNLFFIEENVQGTYYIGKIELPAKVKGEEEKSIFVEFYFKYIPEGLGYPELLVDKRTGFTGEFSNFSFAKYQGDLLVYKFGDFLYPTRLNDFNCLAYKFFDYAGFRHYGYRIDSNMTLIVSKPVKSLFDIISPFSVFFLLLMALSFLIYILIFRKHGGLGLSVNFRLKFQMFIFGILTVSFIVIGLTSAAYIRGIYKQKNADFLNERTQSILIELQQKLKDERIDNEAISGYLQQLLTKFSLVFFSDINLYSTDGHLLASSRPEIFDNGLISRYMNQEAFKMMRFKRTLFFIQQEKIGKGSYYSSYIPLHDQNGNVTAYVNLPYFARESELREEISGFVLAYINIILALTVISVAFALVLSRRLTKPLMMIQERMKTVRIDKVNEKIQWKSKDELGQLVAQYNQLIDELELSAGLLARSEREIAWREMAQQVAHEIKNPLTPMRLSVQHLQHAWAAHDPGIEQKLQRTARTLIEQIDTLSEIASAFSDFAKMPVNKPERVNLYHILQNVVTLFENESQFRIHLSIETTKDYYVYADPKNLSRAFNNLIKNALQAIENKTEGKVSVSIENETNHYRVLMVDNGIGMSDEEKTKIFVPNFTTKSSGMGIGLSIVYNIVTAANGEISFETEINKGTTFVVRLPKVK